MNILTKIKRWYRGGPLPTREANSTTSTTHRLPNTFEPSVLARFAQWVVKNILIILGIVVAASVTLFVHYDEKSTGVTEHEKIKDVIQNDAPK
ncbi:MAG: hypothetical protein AB2817_07035 [Candidatus Thiodiazotropha sp.]